MLECFTPPFKYFQKLPTLREWGGGVKNSTACLTTWIEHLYLKHLHRHFSPGNSHIASSIDRQGICHVVEPDAEFVPTALGTSERTALSPSLCVVNQLEEEESSQTTSTPAPQKPDMKGSNENSNVHVNHANKGKTPPVRTPHSKRWRSIPKAKAATTTFAYKETSGSKSIRSSCRHFQ